MSPSLSAPDSIEPLELWRAWKYDGQRLVSPYSHDRWAPLGAFEATCRKQEHDVPAPVEGCTCGIYALADPDGLPSSAIVFGMVKLWGRVIRGEHGARTQYAYPSTLCVPAALAREPGLLAYRVPLVLVPAEPPDEAYALAA